MSERPLPRLNPDALKTERHDVDLGTEAEAEGHDHVTRAAGKPPETEGVIAQPTSGATPPAR